MKKCLGTLYFFSIGLWISFSRLLVSLIAMQDILAGTLIPTTVLIIVNKVPELLSKVMSPFIVRRVHPGWSMLLGTVLLTAANILVVCYDLVEVRLAGVVMYGVAYGLLSIAVVHVLPCYDDMDVFTAACQSGTNVSSFLASFIYTVLTTWFCASPRTVIAACTPTCLLPYAFYCLLDKEPLKKHNSQHYRTIGTDDSHHERVGTDGINDEPGGKVAIRRFFSKAETKLIFFMKVYPYITYYTMIFFITTITIGSVLTTITFPSAPFRIRDHFLFYVFLFDLGWCFGGFELVLISFLFPKKVELFKIRRLWILVLLQAGILIFLVYLSWYHFVHSVYVVLILCFLQGFFKGSTDVHSLICAADVFQDISDKCTAMGMVKLGNSIGRITGGLLGVFVEGYLRNHCTNDLLLGKFCLTRFETSSAWSKNDICN